MSLTYSTNNAEPNLGRSCELPNPINLKALEEVNWDFGARKKNDVIEGIHPYPAKFIPELPGTLLENIPVPDGTAVLDPFCGSGTTLVECQKRGISSIGIDLNPIACLITRVKTGPAIVGLEDIVSIAAEEARQAGFAKIPEIPNLDHWFEKPIQLAISAINSAILKGPEEAQSILRLALSSIIVRVSNQESDTRYAAIKKDVEASDVFNSFEKSGLKIASALQQRKYPLVDAKIIEANTLEVDAVNINKPISLVITSPPYPNAYEYWLYHKYRMWWLGLDPLAVKNLEIGARAHFFKKNHHTAENFVEQMSQTFDLLSKVIVKGGHACFVVGRSKIHGQIVDNAKIIEEAGMRSGFERAFLRERTISPNRKSFNLSHANIKTESIIVMRLVDK